MAGIEDAHARLHKLGVIAAVIAFAGLLAAAIGSGKADGAKVTVIGAGPKARSACTPANCIVEARVTGFQTRIGRIKKPFLVRFPGRIVAWSVKLGRPSAEDERCLSRGCRNGSFPGFGGPAQARLAVLKRIVDRDRPKPDYKLIRQSPVEVLTPYFGSTVTFTLSRPLNVGKGKIIALTIPTWAPVFANGLGQKNSWRASRKPTRRRGGCFVKRDGVVIGANVNAGRPHQGISRTRRYGCVYRTNRLLYSASVVRRPRR